MGKKKTQRGTKASSFFFGKWGKRHLESQPDEHRPCRLRHVGTCRQHAAQTHNPGCQATEACAAPSPVLQPFTAPLLFHHWWGDKLRKSFQCSAPPKSRARPISCPGKGTYQGRGFNIFEIWWKKCWHQTRNLHQKISITFLAAKTYSGLKCRGKKNGRQKF